MGFLGVHRATYDYAPQAQGELAISEGDLLYILDKNDDDGWWKAKKRAGADDEDEPVGLVPHNYVHECPPLGHANALYEYTRQTDEELSFPEDALLQVFDTSDPDWILVGLDGDYGFVPANYIEMQDPATADEPASPPTAPSLPARPRSGTAETPRPAPVASGPAAALAGVMQGRAAPRSDSPPPQPARHQSVSYDDSRASDDEPIRSPTLPSRPRPAAEPSHRRATPDVDDYSAPTEDRTPGGFHMYNINEMVSVMGKKKKMPTTLGINLTTANILIAPERAQDGPSQEWTGDRMTHYSREGKHVFMELVRPSKSVDFHAGAKDTAEEIVAALGELAGAVRAEGLREVIMAGTNRSHRTGQILYDFMAQGEDEVTVAAGDEVIIVDESKSGEWWQVRRLKTGKEGVVPSSYIEITGTVTPPPDSAGLSAAKSTVEQNRLEEIRLTKEALKASKEPQQVGPGMTLPERGSSLTARANGNDSGQQRSRRENGRSDGQSKSKAKPDSSKVRTWTDRSRSFSVEAQFLGLKDGKIHLHKINGVKIAVPIAKMSRDDLEYVENTTGISLDDDKPLADIRKSKPAEKDTPQVGATVGKNKEPEYDWFQFFLSCEVAVGLCERYAQAFTKDSMDESVLPDVDANVLRTLGLREGDIIKVMRSLDTRFGRDRSAKRNPSDAGTDGDGGLFSGPGGTLRNNTRKGRPAPAVQTSNVVDAKAFSQRGDSAGNDTEAKSPPAVSPTSAPNSRQTTGASFDDDAWDVKPSKGQGPAKESARAAAPAPAPAQPALSGSMKDLSLLTAPLQPTQVEPQPQAAISNTGSAQQQTPTATSQPLPGATPSFFSTVPQPQQSMATGQIIGNHMSPPPAARQRPVPPSQASPIQGSLVPPPPQRPLSAPLSAQPSAFSAPAMLPQMTGALQSRVAPQGQSLDEITQARLQQQYAAQMQQQQPLMTGYPGMNPQAMMPLAIGNPGQFMQPMMTGAPGPSPFADPGRVNQFSPMQSQPTGFQPAFVNTQTPYGQPAPPSGINNYLPPALEPQRTGISPMQPQAAGIGTFRPPPPPPLPSQPQPQPLQPQQTGPAPPVRFGVTGEMKKLAPQPTGRRANLAQATPQNPFGF